MVDATMVDGRCVRTTRVKPTATLRDPANHCTQVRVSQRGVSGELYYSTAFDTLLQPVLTVATCGKAYFHSQCRNAEDMGM